MLSKQFLTFGGGMSVFDLYRRRMNGELALRQDGDLLFLGRENADILKKLGDDLEPVNLNYFTGLHERRELPLIMNYFGAAQHGRIKREHLAHTRQRMGGEFSRRMSAHVRSTFESLTNEGAVDLVVAITDSVIAFHLREFLDIEVSRESIRSLACFEDQFTMGLYLDSEELQTYYGASSFMSHRKEFHALVQQWLNKPAASGLAAESLPSDFVYNFSVAGSTNVAKGFVYGLKLLMEQGCDRQAPGPDAMLRELLRFLPLVDNHVVPCFVVRRPTEEGRARLAEQGYGDINGHVYVFHALHHADPQLFANPDQFDPWRWHDSSSKFNLLTFGIGSHACCGSSLAQMWLHILFDVWQSHFHLVAPLHIYNEPFLEAVPRAHRLTSCTTLAAV